MHLTGEYAPPGNCCDTRKSQTDAKQNVQLFHDLKLMFNFFFNVVDVGVVDQGRACGRTRNRSARGVERVSSYCIRKSIFFDKAD